MPITPQSTLFAALPPVGRSLVFRPCPESDVRAAVAALAAGFDPTWGVVGIGAPLAAACGATIPGLRAFPALSGPGGTVPSTQGALWIGLRGDTPGEVFDRSAAVTALLAPAFVVDDAVATFTYRDGRDLTGYLDGTANPSDEDAPGVALVGAGGAAPAGASFVSVQRWVHDLAGFRAHSADECDAMIGRALADNRELDEAPETAHVKRTAQELYEPTAFMLRRSMPWADARGEGLEFIAYCATLDAFERMLAHMLGCDDGLVDALFRFSRPVTGGHYWCPPLVDGRLDMGALGV